MNAEELLRKAYEVRASDIHITVHSPVMFRIHGTLRPANDKVLTPYDTLELVKELLNSDQYNSFLPSLPVLSRERIFCTM